MAAAFLDLLHKPSVAIINAVAMHPKADDFCRDLSLRSIFDNSAIGTFIVYPNSNAEINLVGRYGPPELSDLIPVLKPEIEITTRNKHNESIRISEINGSGQFKVALVPTSPSASSSGVIAIFFGNEVDELSIDPETQIALAFACEMYCSPSWNYPTIGSLRSKRSTTDDFGVVVLTSRQKKVLELMSEGRTNDRIARLLNYSVATVKNDISSIFQFLGVNNRHDAIDEATKRELLPPPPPANRTRLVLRKLELLLRTMEPLKLPRNLREPVTR